MPKPQKNQPNRYQKKKAQPKKVQEKSQPQPPSLFKNKYYWIILTVTLLVFTFALGFLNQLSAGKESLLLACELSVIGLAFYIGFKSPENYSKRAIFIFVGASIVGFCIWAAIVVSLNATGLIRQITDAIDIDFFAITTLIICLVLGAFIGDLIGKNRAAVELSFDKLRNRLFS